jgi:beta-aspartyl-peptidase (threonine type)
LTGSRLQPAVLIHAGAGARSGELRRHEGEIQARLREVLDAARSVLQRDGQALEAAQAAVVVMEDFPLFNAGCGAALCSDGSAELSACVMRGSDRAAGALAGLRRTRNPILAAGRLLDTPEVLLAGERADAFAASRGLQQVENSYFVTEHQREALRRDGPDLARGTVGAVCRDVHGGLAAATSTGGIRAQPRGRIGDSPLPGAGTWADAGVAVSCTGDGEAFVRSGVSRHIATLVAGGASLQVATQAALALVGELGGTGGLIALGAEDGGLAPFTTQAMPRGRWLAGGEPEVWVTQG